MEKQIPRYFSRLSALLKTGLLKSSPSVSINEEEETDADDRTSEVETDRTGQKVRRDLAKFRRPKICRWGVDSVPEEGRGYSCR